MTTSRSLNSTSAWLRISDIVCAVALAGLCAAAVAMLTGTPGEMKSLGDFSGVLFLVIAAFYVGPMRGFWLVIAPLALGLLFAPLAHWESVGSFVSVNALLRAALVPGFSFIGASLLTTVRQTVLASHEGQAERPCKVADNCS